MNIALNDDLYRTFDGLRPKVDVPLIRFSLQVGNDNNSHSTRFLYFLWFGKTSFACNSHNVATAYSVILYTKRCHLTQLITSKTQVLLSEHKTSSM